VCYTASQFYSQVDDAYIYKKISELQFDKLKSDKMKNVINNWFLTVSDKVFLILNEDKTALKEIIWVRTDGVANKSGEEFATSFEVLRCIKWIKSMSEFGDHTCAH